MEDNFNPQPSTRKELFNQLIGHHEHHEIKAFHDHLSNSLLEKRPDERWPSSLPQMDDTFESIASDLKNPPSSQIDLETMHDAHAKAVHRGLLGVIKDKDIPFNFLREAYSAIGGHQQEQPEEAPVTAVKTPKVFGEAPAGAPEDGGWNKYLFHAKALEHKVGSLRPAYGIWAIPEENKDVPGPYTAATARTIQNMLPTVAQALSLPREELGPFLDSLEEKNHQSRWGTKSAVLGNDSAAEHRRGAEGGIIDTLRALTSFSHPALEKLKTLADIAGKTRDPKALSNFSDFFMNFGKREKFISERHEDTRVSRPGETEALEAIAAKHQDSAGTGNATDPKVVRASESLSKVSDKLTPLGFDVASAGLSPSDHLPIVALSRVINNTFPVSTSDQAADDVTFAAHMMNYMKHKNPGMTSEDWKDTVSQQLRAEGHTPESIKTSVAKMEAGLNRIGEWTAHMYHHEADTNSHYPRARPTIPTLQSSVVLHPEAASAAEKHASTIMDAMLSGVRDKKLSNKQLDSLSNSLASGIKRRSAELTFSPSAPVDIHPMNLPKEVLEQPIDEAMAERIHDTIDKTGNRDPVVMKDVWPRMLSGQLTVEGLLNLVPEKWHRHLIPMLLGGESQVKS